MANRMLSNSEMSARCRNRSEDKSLEEKLTKMTKTLYTSRDGIKEQMQVLRKFRNTTSKNSGWSPMSVRPEMGEDVLVPNSSGRSQTFGSPSNDSNKLQRMWAYTYSGASHNKIYKELHQVGKNSQQSLELRKQTSQENGDGSPQPALASEVFSASGVIKAKAKWSSTRNVLSKLNHSENETLESLNSKPTRKLDRQVSTMKLVNRAKSAWLIRKDTFLNKEQDQSWPESSDDASHSPTTKRLIGKDRLKKKVSIVMGMNKTVEVFTCADCGSRTEESDAVDEDPKLPGVVFSHRGVQRAKSVLTSMLGGDTSGGKVEMTVQKQATSPIKQKQAKCSCNCRKMRRHVSESWTKPGQKAAASVTYSHRRVASTGSSRKQKSNSKGTLIKNTSSADNMKNNNGDKKAPSMTKPVMNTKDKDKERCSSLPEFKSDEREPKENATSGRSSKRNTVSECSPEDNSVAIDSANDNIVDDVFSTETNFPQSADDKCDSKIGDSSVLCQNKGRNEAKKGAEDNNPDNESKSDVIASSGKDAETEKTKTSLQRSDKRVAGTVEDPKYEKAKRGSDKNKQILSHSSSGIKEDGIKERVDDSDIKTDIGSKEPLPENLNSSDQFERKPPGKERKYSLNRKLIQAHRVTSIIKYSNSFIRFQSDRKHSLKPEHRVIKGDDVFTRIAKVLMHQVKLLRRYRQQQAFSLDGQDSSSMDRKDDYKFYNPRLSVSSTTDLGSIAENSEMQCVSDMGDPNNSHSRQNRRRRSVSWGNAIASTSAMHRFGIRNPSSDSLRNNNNDNNNNSNSNSNDHVNNDNYNINYPSLRGDNSDANGNKPNQTTGDNSRLAEDGRSKSNTNDKNNNASTTATSSNRHNNNNNNNNNKSNNCSDNNNNNNSKATSNNRDKAASASSYINRLPNINGPKPSRGVTSRPFGGKSGQRNPATYHRGIRLTNYVSPQHRYKMADSGKSKRNLSIRWHSAVGVMVNSHQPQTSQPLDTAVSKDVRQRALNKMVEENHAKGDDDPVEVISPALRNRIERFLVSVEPYCKKNTVF